MPVRRFPSWRFVAGAAVVCGAVLLWFFTVVHFQVPSAGDAEEARELWEAVTRGNALPAGADAGWRPGRDRSTLVVHGVRDPAAQDRVLDVVRAARRPASEKIVVVEFRTEATTQGELLRREDVR